MIAAGFPTSTRPVVPALSEEHQLGPRPIISSCLFIEILVIDLA